MKHDIALIIPYYGSFPNYFPIWMQSVAKNPEITFFLVTDIPLQEKVPDNIRIVAKSFQNLREEIQLLFEFEITLNLPYKLCEYRPVYGVLFADLLQKYDFWGYCDVDVIFGNIAAFLTEDVLDQHDIILSHGHFMLFRNNMSMNELFRRESNKQITYQQVFTSEISYHFDEWGGISRIAEQSGVSMYDETVFADIRYQWFDFRLAQGRQDGKKRLFVWEDGKLVEYSMEKTQKNVTREIMYIHLQKRPMSWNGELGTRYLIYPNVISSSQEDVTEQVMKRYCRKKVIYMHYIMFRLKYIISKSRVLIREGLFWKAVGKWLL